MRQLSWAGWTAGFAAGGVLSVLGASWRDHIQALAGTDLPAAFTSLASLAALALAAWILLILTLLVITPTLGRHVAPRALRRAFIRQAVVVGAIGAFSIAPASAESGQATSTTPPLPSVHGLRLPDRPMVAFSATHPEVQKPPATTVTVQPGDTLWAIASQHLPPSASDTEIAQSCEAWWRTNQDVIGSNPDLILPHQNLTPPSKERP